MTRRLLLAALLAVFGVSFALAAPIEGKVTAIDGVKVTIELTGEKAPWMKKGAGVKLLGGTGKIVSITGTTLTINTKKAPELKVGGPVSLEKGPAQMTGC